MPFPSHKEVITLALIDDDPVVEIILQKQLHRLPLELQPILKGFRDGPQALRYFQQEREKGNPLPDVVFLDLNMPMLNGWEVLDELCKIPVAERPLIYIISSSINPEDQHTAYFRPEVQEFLCKPIQQETIFTLFQKLSSLQKQRVQG